jgi:hypothetical protein
VLEGQSNLAEAMQAYHDSLAILERLAKADPAMPSGSAISPSAMPNSLQRT